MAGMWPPELVLALFEEHAGYDAREKLLALFPRIADQSDIGALHVRYRGYPATLKALRYMSIKQSINIAFRSVGHRAPGFPMLVWPTLSFSPGHVHRTGDIWVLSIVFGTNVQWIEVVIGDYVLPGSRVYYRQPKDGRGTPRFCRYNAPQLMHNYAGCPMAMINMSVVRLTCNHGGTIHRSSNHYGYLDFPTRSQLLLVNRITVPQNYPYNKTDTDPLVIHNGGATLASMIPS